MQRDMLLLHANQFADKAAIERRIKLLSKPL